MNDTDATPSGLTQPLPDTMPKITLGRTGLEISTIGWGMAGIDTYPDSVKAIAQVYAQRGGNFLDTAPSYGASEDVIRDKLPNARDRFIVATKSHPVDADKTLRDVESSLKRMQIDAIDLFYAPHGCRDREQLHNTLRKGGVLEGALKAKDRGLVRHLAFSYDYFGELGDAGLLELIATDAFDAVQLPYGLVPVEPADTGVIPAARERGMGIIANFPTLNGLTAREWGVFYRDFADLACTPGQATVLAVLCNPGIDCVLTRFSSTARAEENCWAARCAAALTRSEQDALRERTATHGNVRLLHRRDVPPAPAGVRFRYGMIFFDLYTRFGYGAARAQVERFLDELDAQPDFTWDAAGQEMIDEVRRMCPVRLT